MLVVVPNELHAAINVAIDTALDGRQCDEASREHIYRTILAYVDEHGVLPEFSLQATQ